MTDADLIYNALLRAEKRFEAWAARDPTMPPQMARLGELVVQTIREEIGNGMAVRAPAGLDAISGKVD